MKEIKLTFVGEGIRVRLDYLKPNGDLENVPVMNGVGSRRVNENVDWHEFIVRVFGPNGTKYTIKFNDVVTRPKNPARREITSGSRDYFMQFVKIS